MTETVYRQRPTKLFGEERVLELLEFEGARALSHVENEKEDYLVGVGPDQYIEFLAAQYAVAPVVIDTDQAVVAESAQYVSAELFPVGFAVRVGKQYRKQVFHFTVPYGGNKRLLRCGYIDTTYPARASISQVEFTFDVIAFKPGDIEQVKRWRDNVFAEVNRIAGRVNAHVRAYNDGLRSRLAERFDAKKREVLERRQMLASLEMPLRKRADVAKSFAVPAPKSLRRLRVRPTPATASFVPEPALAGENYQEILQIFEDFGRALERTPSVCAGKREEALRDLFLMQLAPRYDLGSATGETFNKSGKTDILLRWKSTNVFVAEFKVWGGQVQHSRDIDQLLSYLTVRDSKTALVVFVRNKNFSQTVKKMMAATEEHPLCIRRTSAADESRVQFRFKVPGDPSRELDLCVLAFHAM